MKSRYKCACNDKTGELTFKPDSSDNIRALTLYEEVVGVNPTLATNILIFYKIMILLEIKTFIIMINKELKLKYIISLK